MEIRQSTQVRVPVRLVDASGAVITGALFSEVAVYLIKQGGSVSAKIMADGDLPELHATNVPGHYDLVLSASNTDTLGFLRYQVTRTGTMTYNGLVNVVANLESDTYALVNDTPTNAELTAALADLPTNAELATALDPLALEASLASLATAAAVAAIPTGPALASDWTPTRAAKIDNLDVASSTRASAADMTTALASLSALTAAVAAIPATPALAADLAAAQADIDALTVKLAALWQVAGLDLANPCVRTPTSIAVGTIAVAIADTGADEVTLTRSA